MEAVSFPTEAETFDALRIVGRLLGEDWAYLVDSTYHFCLDDDLTLAVTPESARRLRLQVCAGGRARCSIWTRVDDHSRLEDSVTGLTQEIRTLVG